MVRLSKQAIERGAELGGAAATSGGTCQLDDDKPRPPHVFKAVGQGADRPVARKQSLTICGLRPRAQVKGGMAAVSISEVDEPDEGTGRRVHEGMLGTGVRVERDRRGTRGGAGEAAGSDFLHVQRPVEAHICLERVSEAIEGV